MRLGREGGEHFPRKQKMVLFLLLCACILVRLVLFNIYNVSIYLNFLLILFRDVLMDVLPLCFTIWTIVRKTLK